MNLNEIIARVSGAPLFTEPRESLAERYPRNTKIPVNSYKKIPGFWEICFSRSGVRYIPDNGANCPWLVSWEHDQAESDPISEIPIYRGLSPSQAAIAGENLHILDDFSALITPNFSYGEFTKFEEERRFQYADQCLTALDLATFLERVRSQFGSPVRLTSGYRPPEINAAVNGATWSEHLYRAPGLGAVDFFVEGISLYTVQDWVDREWRHSLGYAADLGFIHLGIGRGRVRWYY